MEDTGGAWREFQSTMEETAIIVGDKLLPHFVKVLEKNRRFGYKNLVN